MYIEMTLTEVYIFFKTVSPYRTSKPWFQWC